MSSLQRLVDDRHWAKVRDWLLVTVSLFAIGAFILTSVVTIQTNATVSRINERQLETVQSQNDAQLCTQHDIIVAVRSIGRKLGLPTRDIVIPDITGVECP